MGGVGGGRLFEGGRLLNFSAFRMGAYSRWALIRGWALIRINTVSDLDFFQQIKNHGRPVQNLMNKALRMSVLYSTTQPSLLRRSAVV